MRRFHPIAVTCLVVAQALLVLLTAACGQPEDPARVELRQRLGQPASLSIDELDRVLGEVNRSLAGKRVRIKEGDSLTDLNDAQRATVLGMLTNPIGVFDEGLRTDTGTPFRVLNAPDLTAGTEIEAARRLFVDPKTFLPGRFELTYAFPGHGDYAFDLTVDP